MDHPFKTEFEGTERFAIRRKLGAGTSGSVYEAYDRERKTIVALKTLNQVDPAAIYRFKKEFRALADVNHRNLVQLYELLSDGQRWFFTMELVKGQPFTDHVRRMPLPFQSLTDEAPTLLDHGQLAAAADSAPPPAAPQPAPPLPAEGLPFDLGRLRGALRQLSEGLAALHDTGKLHCDIKPSNVIVAPDGRVVLLDLGLVREQVAQPIYESIQEDIVGTPAYMSPEQAAGLPITRSSDWYSVGAVLYEALTGRIPFTGGIMRILTDKQRIDPPPPVQLVPQVPEDLDTLCRALLHRDPEKRPTGRDVLRWLGTEADITQSTIQRATSSSITSAPFVGREEQMEQLMESFRGSRQGRTVAVFVHGSSGMGKSALVRRFLQDLRHQHEDVVLLAGRCYQRESVPYKALDSLVDALSRYLRSLPDQEAELLMPYNVLALARLFPVLRRVQAVANARRRVLEIPDSRELRRRAFGALRELFLRLTDRCPVVLYIDDLQWGDLDSASLLNELLRPPDPPPLMLLACFRSEEAESSPLLRSLFSSEFSRGALDMHEVVLRELAPEDAYRVAMQLLRDDSPATRSLAETIARESAGNPFFIDALVRYAQTVAAEASQQRDVAQVVGEATLEKVMQAYLHRLPAEARRLLEVVAVAGRPMGVELARQAAEVEELQPALAALRSANLVRLRGSRPEDEIECYHDRIREVVPKLLDKATLKGYHLRLAQVLQTAGRVDPETLAIHFEEAGLRDRAAEFASQAADQAAEALAFDRAARLYRIALDLSGSTGEVQRSLRVKLGDALANAGRGAAAADAYLAAAEGAKAAHALELRRRAAEQQLISGHIDQGRDTIRDVLASIGMKLAPTPRQALLSLLRRIAQLKLRGLKFQERDSTQISAERLIQIDTCWSVSVGLGIVDTIHSLDYSKRNLLLSLKAGEPYRVCRALCIETIASATSGSKGQARTQNLLEASMRLAQRVSNPHAQGLAHMAAGMAAYLEGRWQKASERLDHGEEILRERCTGVTWELDTTMQFQLRALVLLGEYGEICRRLPSLLKDVQERGDLYAETNLRSRFTWISWLVSDQPAKAEEEVALAIHRWSQQGFHLQHYWHMTGRVEIAMYSGQGLEAWQRLQEPWAKLEKSLLLRIQFTSIEALNLRARCALAAAVEAGPETREGRQLMKVVDADVKKIRDEKLFWADPLALLVAAGAQIAAGRRDQAEELLDQALTSFEAHDMRLHAAAARLRRGQLQGGTRGRELMQEAEEQMRAQTIVEPARMADVLAPGAWDLG